MKTRKTTIVHAKETAVHDSPNDPGSSAKVTANKTRRAPFAWALVLTLFFLLPGPPIASAGPCRSNSWQPTFVHDLRPGYYQGPYYVMPNGTFEALENINGSYVQNACDLIRRFGIRDRRGYTDCLNYTRIQCGCDEQSLRNSTCDNFLRFHNQHMHQ